MSSTLAGMSGPFDSSVAEAVHERHQALVGKYIAATHHLELRLNRVLTRMFEVPEFLEWDFAFFVLARMSMSARIEALSNLIKTAEVPTDVVGRLREANAFRNLLAHSAAGTSDGTFGEDAAVYYLQIKNGKHVSVKVTLVDCEERIRQVESLSDDLSDVLSDRVIGGYEPRRQKARWRSEFRTRMTVEAALEEADAGDSAADPGDDADPQE
jgi:hypothetical protein